MKKWVIGIIAVVLIIIGVVLAYYSKQNYSYSGKNENSQNDGEISQTDTYGVNHEQENIDQNAGSNNENSFIGAPLNLALPFDVEDAGGGNEFFTPFGLIRHERDKGYGHAGIDIPLSRDDEIYAVSDGKIVANYPATDGGEGNNFEGNNVVLLITEGYRQGEGWGFLYEHIDLISGINVGSVVSKGQLIGASALANGNNHLGLVYYFNNFKYVKDPRCWIEHLNSEDKQRLLAKWEEIQVSSKFIQSWNSTFEDGAYPYRALLDETNYPNGPQLCYEYGLNVREFA